MPTSVIKTQVIKTWEIRTDMASYGKLQQQQAKLKKDIAMCHKAILYRSRTLAGYEHNIKSGDFDDGQMREMQKKAADEKKAIGKLRTRMEKDLRAEKKVEAALRQAGEQHG